MSLVHYFNSIPKIILFTTIICTSHFIHAQNVGIGTSTPDNSAKLHIVDANRGLLLPQVSLVDVANGTTPVNTPATGLLVWNTNTTTTNGDGVGFYYWTGVIWEKLASSSNNNAWLTTGNSGTTNGTNFIGTIDNQALDIRTNNTIKARFTTNGQIEILNTGQSVFIGESAGINDDLTTNRNTFVGYQAGQSTTSGAENVAIGTNTLTSNTTGNYNIAIGMSALTNSTTTGGNVAVGHQALNNTTNDGNTGVGFQSLLTNTTGYSNTALGK